MITSVLTRRWLRAGRGGRRHARALLATLAGASLAVLLAASPAGAQTPRPPAPGVAPGTAVVGSDALLFYTATNGAVWMKNQNNGQFTPAGGHLIGGPAATANGNTAFVFGQGTNNQLWENSCNLNICGSWRSLGGTITSKPGAVFRGPGAADYSVYARGTDGAVWARDHSASGWGAWHAIGGRLLAGTGPAAAYLAGTYLLVVGTNRQLYIEKVGVTGFKAAGGATTASPALTAIPSAQNLPAALVGFVRGTNNAGYYHRFLSSSPGWHSVGGRLTSGLAAATRIRATIPDTLTFGLGTNSQIYENVGTWGAYPPTFSGWHRVT